MKTVLSPRAAPDGDIAGIFSFVFDAAAEAANRAKRALTGEAAAKARREEAERIAIANGVSYGPTSYTPTQMPVYPTVGPAQPPVDVAATVNAALAQQQAEFRQALAAQQQAGAAAQQQAQADTILGMPKNVAIVAGAGLAFFLYTKQRGGR